MALTDADREEIEAEPDINNFVGAYRAQLLENVVISDEEAEVALTDVREEDWSDDLMNREAYKTLTAETADTYRAGSSSVSKSPCLSSDNTGGTATSGGGAGGAGGAGGTGSPPVEVPIPVKAGKVDLGKLKGHVPPNAFSGLILCVEKYNVNTNVRMAHFLGQCKTECSLIIPRSENTNYTKPASLIKLFGSTRGNRAAQFIGNPEKIANIIYANKLGNGSEETGDGFRFRGKGWIQLTGKSNYKSFANSMNRQDILTNSDLVAGELSPASAGHYCSSRGTLKKADAGFSSANCKAVSLTVNSVPVHQDKREKFTLEFAKILGAI